MPPLFTPDFWAFVCPPEYPDYPTALRELYAKLGSLEAVGRKLGVSKTPLLRVFRELGIKLRSHGGWRWGKRNSGRSCNSPNKERGEKNDWFNG